MSLSTPRFLSVLILVSLAASAANASNYPPDYPVCHVDDSLSSGPFELIQHQEGYGQKYGLTVAYRGYLRGRYNDNEIWFYIRLNGHDIWAQAHSGTHDDAYVHLWAGPRDCRMCYGYTNDPECDRRPGSWICNDPTPNEAHLFFWADGNWALNAWDIEVAATAGGEWDSDWGHNFRARFEPRSRCD